MRCAKSAFLVWPCKERWAAFITATGPSPTPRRLSLLFWTDLRWRRVCERLVQGRPLVGAFTTAGGSQQIGKILRRQWMAVQIPLPEVTSQLAQKAFLRFSLDSAHHHFQVHQVRQTDHGPNETVVAYRLAAFVEDTVVDLEQMHWQRLEITVRRSAGTEIVNGKANAVGRQRVDEAGNGLEMLENHVLLHFQHQLRWCESCRRQNRQQTRSKTRIAQLIPGQIDRQERQGITLLLPAENLRAGRLQYPVAKAEHQPGLLGDDHEVAGQQHPVATVVPAQQRFAADDLTAIDGDDGLISQ